MSEEHQVLERAARAADGGYSNLASIFMYLAGDSERPKGITTHNILWNNIRMD